MSLGELVERSLGQVRLLVEASDRLEARRDLAQLDATMAGMAACWSKEGGRFALKLREALIVKSEGRKPKAD